MNGSDSWFHSAENFQGRIRIQRCGVVWGGFHRQRVVAILEWATAACLLGALILLLLPTVPRPSSRGQPDCSGNLRSIGLALHNYHEVYGSLPPAYLTNGDGVPLLSWRVLILPWLDEMALYRRFELDQPWYSPDNSKLLAEMPSVFRCPNGMPEATGRTHYVVSVGVDTAFPDASSVRLWDIKDGTGNTLLVVEDPEFSVPWAAPMDVSTEDWISHVKLSRENGPHSDGQFVLLGDGMVRFLRYDTDPKTLRALLLISDGAPVGPF